MPETSIIKSYYRESSTFSSLCTHRILRAGHIKTHGDYLIRRSSVVGHEFIFCLNGAGWVEVGSKKHFVHQGQLVWLPVNSPHAHYPDKNKPWEIYWIRADGGKLANLMEFLQIPKRPTFLVNDNHRVVEIFESIFKEMDTHSLLSDMKCDLLMSELLVIVSEIRSDHESPIQDPLKHKGLINLIYSVQSHYAEEWDVERFTRFCQVSKSQLFRMFDAAFGVSPIKWLKQYRLTQARRLMVDTDKSISEIAFLVGYKDTQHFHRDFKKETGKTPKVFRYSERL